MSIDLHCTMYSNEWGGGCLGRGGVMEPIQVPGSHFGAYLPCFIGRQVTGSCLSPMPGLNMRDVKMCTGINWHLGRALV